MHRRNSDDHDDPKLMLDYFYPLRTNFLIISDPLPRMVFLLKTDLLLKYLLLWTDLQHTNIRIVFQCTQLVHQMGPGFHGYRFWARDYMALQKEIWVTVWLHLVQLYYSVNLKCFQTNSLNSQSCTWLVFPLTFLDSRFQKAYHWTFKQILLNVL